MGNLPSVTPSPGQPQPPKDTKSAAPEHGAARDPTHFIWQSGKFLVPLSNLNREDTPRYLSKVAMHRTANPFTAVRFRQVPPRKETPRLEIPKRGVSHDLFTPLSCRKGNRAPIPQEAALGKALLRSKLPPWPAEPLSNCRIRKPPRQHLRAPRQT